MPMRAGDGPMSPTEFEGGWRGEWLALEGVRFLISRGV
jgi:hypothetical protein